MKCIGSGMWVHSDMVNIYEVNSDGRAVNSWKAPDGYRVVIDGTVQVGDMIMFPIGVWDSCNSDDVGTGVVSYIAVARPETK